MDGLNRFTGLGNLGAEPELRVTPGGSAVLKMRVACTTSFLNANKERQERTEWVNVTVWGKRGEALAKILDKGSRVYFEGELRTNVVETDGQKRYFTEVNASNIVLAGQGKISSGSRPADGPGSEPVETAADGYPTTWDGAGV